MSPPVVLITGALTGIGRAAALLLREKAIASSFPAVMRTSARRWLPSCVSSAAKRSSSAPTWRRDDDVRSLVDQTIARFGRLDAAVNSAGTEGKPGPVTSRPPTATPHVRHQCARHAAKHEA